MTYWMPAPQKSTIIPIKLSGEDVWACLCTLYWQVDKCKQHWSERQIRTCSLQLCVEDIQRRNGTTLHPTSLSFWHPSPLESMFWPIPTPFNQRNNFTLFWLEIWQGQQTDERSACYGDFRFHACHYHGLRLYNGMYSGRFSFISY